MVVSHVPVNAPVCVSVLALSRATEPSNVLIFPTTICLCSSGMLSYTFEDVKKASKLIRWYGFNLGHQMMVGLPESTRIDEINTAKELIRLKKEERIEDVKYDYEELDEFFGMEEIRSINQSLLRGGDIFYVFYSYNPPKSINSWVNAEVINERKDRLVHTSCYLDVPKEWLGEQFIIEAEHLKETNELAYRNEYLGEPTGTGGAVFTNITLRPITDEEISHFDKIKDGIDFGYAVDPACYLQMHFDKTRKKLYIFN